MTKMLINIIFLWLWLFCYTAEGQSSRIFYAHKNIEDTVRADTSGLVYTVYLLGDIKNTPEGRFNLARLRKHLLNDGKKSAAIILGDIIYPLGLPDSGDKNYQWAIKDADMVLSTFKGYKGKVYFLPGNHDWARGRKGGWEAIKNAEKYIEHKIGKGNVYLPDGGCPGPVEVSLTDDITVIIFDSQWWFQQNEKPGPDDGCGFSGQEELFVRIEDALRRNRDKKVILATHHPLYSVGEHSGYFPASYLLFPLLEFNNWMYLPLPGFLYVGYRKYLGSIQDLAHSEYKAFRSNLLTILKKYPDVIYAAGHEHNLEYFDKDSLHHIIAGAGGKASYIARKKKYADFACQCTGFNRLLFYQNGDVVTEFIKTDSTLGEKVVYRRKLFNKPFTSGTEQKITGRIKPFPDSITTHITSMYNAGKVRRFLLGNNYRNIWDAPVRFPVFDVGKVKGGLTPVKRGGGMQTRSVRLADSAKRQYVLRSVNKYVEKALPQSFRKTIAQKPVQDEISASNPYGAVTVPPLADAIGVMHTNPVLYWVPDDPRFGVYREDLADNVFLFEERPAGNRKDVASFGRSENIVSTAKTIKKTLDNPKHRVDQKAVVRARLLDMLINDWDRHDDQWRWATFKRNGKTIYRPIPRDRDQVYFVNEGPVMWLVSRKWLMPKFQGFDDTIKNITGLNYNARYFDRSFITEPDQDDWLKIAADIKLKITDSVIHAAIKRFPENIYDSIGNETERKLRARRDALPFYAKEYYRVLARSVDVVGTDEHDLFMVERKENGDTKVTVYSAKKDHQRKKIYSRYFKADETKEIRLYGLKRKDKFIIRGNGKKGMMIRVIGGKGCDTVIDSSGVGGRRKKTVVYDRKDKNNFIRKSRETKLCLSRKKSVNEYNRRQFKYNKTIPLLWAGYNIDDGFLLGGGIKIDRYNFRDSTIQKIQGNLSFETGAFAVRYQGLFTAVSSVFDLYLDAEASFPKNVDNYFGLGNNTEKLTDEKKYYRVRYQYAGLNPMLKQTVSKHLYYGFGAFYQYFKVTDTAGRFIGDIFPDVLDSASYASHHYLGANIIVDIDTRNNKKIPLHGVHWKTEISGYYGIKETADNFIKIRSDMSFYLSFRKDPRVVFAFRAGGAANFGDYEFYYANFLGGKTNLRGFRSNRFAGDYSFYQNSEVRFKITDLNSYLVTGKIGLLVFNDVGRVWVKEEDSKRWHDGYGVGFWFAPFNLSVLTLNYNHSREDNLITFTFSYSF